MPPEAQTDQSADSGGYVEFTGADGFKVETNTMSLKELKESSERVEEPKDQPTETDEERDARRTSEAAAKLGKKGGEAAAKRKAQPIPLDKLKGKEDDKAEAKSEETDEEKERAEFEKWKAQRGNPRHDAQARVAEATREAKQHRERAQQLEQELAQLKRQSQAPTGNGHARDVDPRDPEPQEDQFPDYRQYVKAQAGWEARQALRAERRQMQEAQQREEAQRQTHQQVEQYRQTWDERLGTFKQRIGSATKDDPQFWDGLSERMQNLVPSVAARAAGIPITGEHAVTDLIIRAENAPTLLRYFSGHEDEFQRIAALGTPHEITWEMASLSTRLGLAATDSAPRVEASKAHPPPNPVSSGASRASDSNDIFNSGSFEEHERKMNAYDKKRQRA